MCRQQTRVGGGGNCAASEGSYPTACVSELLRHAALDFWQVKTIVLAPWVHVRCVSGVWLPQLPPGEVLGWSPPWVFLRGVWVYFSLQELQVRCFISNRAFTCCPLLSPQAAAHPLQPKTVCASSYHWRNRSSVKMTGLVHCTFLCLS